MKDKVKESPKEQKPKPIRSGNLTYETKEGEIKPEPKKEPETKMPKTETKE